MKKIISEYSLVDLLVLPILGILLIIVGSFIDFNASQALYQGENFFTTLVSLIGKLPMYLAIALSGIYFLLALLKDGRKPIRIISYCCLILPLGAGAVYGYDDLSDLTGTALGIILGIVIVAAISALFFWLLWKKDNRLFMQKAIVLLICAVFTFLIVYFLKQGSGRPRYYFVLEELNESGNNLFLNWWEYGSNIRANYPDVASRAFESFPSGHAAGAACLSLLPVFMDSFNRPKGKAKRFFYDLYPIYVFLFVAMVVLGRLLDGSHYLSDLGFGILFGSLPVEIILLTLKLQIPKDAE